MSEWWNEEESQKEFERAFSERVERERESTKEKDAQTDGKSERDKTTETQAQQLTKISTAAGLFHAPDGTGYADISINGHRETWAIRSRGFRLAYARVL
jgi:hypothetical protein